ncbi:MAG: Vi polysaccharide biosynthesis UDP-N-acetylglucosamine C-6 dehydrogenase TviB [Pseudomonadota bacterium]
MDLDETVTIGIVGLGYVGLPLAVAFGKQYRVVGYDIDGERVAALRQGRDSTLELSSAEIAEAERLVFSHDGADLAGCNVYIVTVPTPIDSHKHPDFVPLQRASELLGGVIAPGDTIIYESTVYPGTTEEMCLPIVEAASGLVLNRDFFVGYSPERVSPGDKARHLSQIMKITSGSTPQTANFVDRLYRSIITAGTHPVSSIRVAEAAKVIENTQRDVNIALVNELSMIFNRLGIDTEEVLVAAGTKWNFLPFRPGLVGGHCIGVDPYYLTHKAEATGYYPEMILVGRRINEQMGGYVAGQVIKLMAQKRIPVADAKILILGFTFKENCPDLRNTRVIDVVRELENYQASVEVHDPWADVAEARRDYGISLIEEPPAGAYDAVIVAVAHQQFLTMGSERIHAFGKDSHVLYDIKCVLPADRVDGRL